MSEVDQGMSTAGQNFMTKLFFVMIMVYVIFRIYLCPLLLTKQYQFCLFFSELYSHLHMYLSILYTLMKFIV